MSRTVQNEKIANIEVLEDLEGWIDLNSHNEDDFFRIDFFTKSPKPEPQNIVAIFPKKQEQAPSTKQSKSIIQRLKANLLQLISFQQGNKNQIEIKDECLLDVEYLRGKMQNKKGKRLICMNEDEVMTALVMAIITQNKIHILFLSCNINRSYVQNFLKEISDQYNVNYNFLYSPNILDPQKPIEHENTISAVMACKVNSAEVFGYGLYEGINAYITNNLTPNLRRKNISTALHRTLYSKNSQDARNATIDFLHLISQDLDRIAIERLQNASNKSDIIHALLLALSENKTNSEKLESMSQDMEFNLLRFIKDQIKSTSDSNEEITLHEKLPNYLTEISKDEETTHRTLAKHQEIMKLFLKKTDNSNIIEIEKIPELNRNTAQQKSISTQSPLQIYSEKINHLRITTQKKAMSEIKPKKEKSCKDYNIVTKISTNQYTPNSIITILENPALFYLKYLLKLRERYCNSTISKNAIIHHMVERLIAESQFSPNIVDEYLAKFSNPDYEKKSIRTLLANIINELIKFGKQGYVLSSNYTNFATLNGISISVRANILAKNAQEAIFILYKTPKNQSIINILYEIFNSSDQKSIFLSNVSISVGILDAKKGQLRPKDVKKSTNINLKEAIIAIKNTQINNQYRMTVDLYNYEAIYCHILRCKKII